MNTWQSRAWAPPGGAAGRELGASAPSVSGWLLQVLVAVRAAALGPTAAAPGGPGVRTASRGLGPGPGAAAAALSCLWSPLTRRQWTVQAAAGRPRAGLSALCSTTLRGRQGAPPARRNALSRGTKRVRAARRGTAAP